MPAITIKLDGAEEAMKALDSRLVVQAARRMIKHVTPQTKNQSARLVVKKYNIKQGDLLKKGSGSDRIKVGGFSSDGLSATITFLGGGISLSYFGAVDYRLINGRLVKQSRTKGALASRKEQKKRGVEVAALRGDKKAVLRAFMTGVDYGGSKKKGTAATGKHIGVFRRTGKGRFPIAEQKMISVMSMIQKDDVLNPLAAFTQHKMQERFAHELNRLGFGGLS
jgi:hypothetical protein